MLVIVSVSSYYFLMCDMVAQLECVHCRVRKGPALSGLITPYADVRVPSRCHKFAVVMILCNCFCFFLVWFGSIKMEVLNLLQLVNILANSGVLEFFFLCNKKIFTGKCPKDIFQ